MCIAHGVARLFARSRGAGVQLNARQVEQKTVFGEAHANNLGSKTNFFIKCDYYVIGNSQATLFGKCLMYFGLILLKCLRVVEIQNTKVLITVKDKSLTT